MTLLFVYLAIAIGISFLCSVLEAVLLSITPSYVEQVSTTSTRSGEILAASKEKLDQSLSSILILNTFAHTMVLPVSVLGIPKGIISHNAF